MDALDALLNRLIPRDEFPGAVDFGLAVEVHRRVPGVESLLARIGDIGQLQPADQDAALAQLELEGDLTFTAIVEVTHELYYADPRSWRGVGYTTRLPNRP